MLSSSSYYGKSLPYEKSGQSRGGGGQHLGSMKKKYLVLLDQREGDVAW